MNLEHGFLDDIVAHPHDSGLWLIFADWLEENNDPRGELVRLWRLLLQEPSHRQIRARRKRFGKLFASGVTLPLPRYTNPLGMEFVWVPSGKCWLGGGSGKPGDEHAVFPEPFWMGVYLVTQKLWREVMPRRKVPSDFSRRGAQADMVRHLSAQEIAQFPVECVSWEDAHQFLAILNEREPDTGWTYCLPTSAEWEFAVRSPVTCKQDCAFSYYFATPTNDLSSTEANFDGNHPVGQGIKGPYLERPCPVGSFAPNRLGLYDLHGNMWEWTMDGEGSIRIRRGGSWHAAGMTCSAGEHETVSVTLRYDRQGFRVARKRV
jgi:uncharacterized protein (TIGR02996 family)